MIELVESIPRNFLAEKIDHFNSQPKEFGESSYVRKDRSYIFAIDTTTTKVVGVLCYVESSAWYPEYMGIGYVSIAERYKNRKIASALLEALYVKAQRHSKGVKVGSYEPEGQLYLPSVFVALEQKFQVPTLH